MDSYLPLRVGPEIKNLLQGGMSGKGSLLAKPSGQLISMENSDLGLPYHRSCFLTWGVWHVFQARNLAGNRYLLSLRCMSIESLGLNLFFPPRFLAWFDCPM